MEEHESNLRDLYAGFAMLAMIMRGHTSVDDDVPARAWDMADHMISSRHNHADEGIAAIKKGKRHARRKAADEDLREETLSDL